MRATGGHRATSRLYRLPPVEVRVAHWPDARPNFRPPHPSPEETSMLTREKTADFVKRWVAAFESKDLDRVLAFYSNDVIFHSPLIARLSHDPSGTVQGKAALRAYVKKGFEVFDHIKFTVLDVLRGVDSIAIHYKGITGTHVVEVLFFDKDGAVRESYVHYSSPE